MWQIGMKYCLARAMNKQKEENEDNKTDNDVFIIVCWVLVRQRS